MVPISQMKSPGVFIDEVDLSTYVAIMDTSKVFGIVTIAQNGPIGEVTDIDAVGTFESTFGYPISAGGLTCTLLAGITASLKVVRVAGGSAEYRSVTLKGKNSEGGSAVDNAVVVTPKYKGTLFSDALSISVKRIKGEDDDKLNLIITKGENDNKTELVNSKFTIVANKASDEYPYLIGDESTDFRFTLGSTEAVVASIDEVTDSAFSLGNNGEEFTDEQIREAIDEFDDAENIDLDLLSSPGILTPAAQLRLITVAENRKDCFAILDPPQGLSPQETADYVNGSNEDHTIQKLDSSFAGIYSPWGKTYNQYTGVNEWVPPSVGVLTAMAKEYTNAAYNAWTPPAGIPRLEISIFSELERKLKRKDRDILYESHVNPLCNYKQQGLTAFGQKTLQRKKSALDRINVRFLVNYIKKIADYSTTFYLFSDINENTFSMWVKDITEQLEPIRLRGGLYDYKVTMDWTTVTDDYLNNNIMPGIIQIKPTKTAEFIPIDVVIKNRSDDFD